MTNNTVDPSDQPIQLRWSRLMAQFEDKLGKKPGLEAILFLVGIRELGKPKQEFTKEQKQDLMHIALCAILAPSGYYKLSHLDQDGWPHWEAEKTLPFQNIFEQEIFLRSHIIQYFESIWEI